MSGTEGKCRMLKEGEVGIMGVLRSKIRKIIPRNMIEYNKNI